MYLKKIKIWNFRSFGSKENNEPGLELEFDPKLNLLIGANDSGKTAIVDAIRYCLGTQTFDPIRIEIEDFYQDSQTKNRATELKIECLFAGFSDEEAGQFLEWIDINKDTSNNVTKGLKVWFTAINKGNRIITNLRAGIDDEGQFLVGDARDLIRVTYLKPLRDAETELSSGYRSRLYQILKSHSIFQKENINEKHTLEKYFEQASKLVLEFFDKEKLEKNDDLGITGNEIGGNVIKKLFIEQTKDFLEILDKREPKINISQTELDAILRKLELLLDENKAGLGTLNLLYMAAELIHLRRENYLGLRLGLIEELEAHLHPQAQLRVLKSLLEERNNNVQFILTTHSTTLGSSIPLKHLKLCINNNVFSLDINSTALGEGDYQFLERFLDATKANLFFAKGVIIVEGDSENILLPTIAEIIERPLQKYGVSIVNVGSRAFLKYSNIFKRKDGSSLPIKVAILTDFDLKINEVDKPTANQDEIQKKKEEKEKYYNSNDGNIKVFISPLKTMEFDIALGNLFNEIHLAIQIAKKIQSNKDWISDGEIEQIKSNLSLSVEDPNSRAKTIFEPLEKHQASKTVAAQWFAKLLNVIRADSYDKIKKDYVDNTGIKYIIEAIEHVTEKINWNDEN